LTTSQTLVFVSIASAVQKLLRFFFHHFYHAFAWTYDFVAALVSIGRWKNWVFTALPFLAGPRVLEIGFGPGHLQIGMRKKGLIAFGLDESRQMGRMALARIKSSGFPVSLSRGYAQRLPFGAACFDEAVATFPSEYIYDPQTLAEVYRVLKPGGKFVVVPMAWIQGRKLWERLAAWVFHITRQSVVLTEAAEGRVRTYFTAAGFRVSLLRVELLQSTVLVIMAEKSNKE
jgi:ubiquinone/menaquinone biosynthesis C-methylase UbiE